MTARDRVRDALQRLCEDQPGPGQILFKIHFSARRVAEESGVSESAARKHLNDLSQCRGYSRTIISGTYGYRYDAEYA